MQTNDLIENLKVLSNKLEGADKHLIEKAIDSISDLENKASSLASYITEDLLLAEPEDAITILCSNGFTPEECEKFIQKETNTVETTICTYDDFSIIETPNGLICRKPDEPDTPVKEIYRMEPEFYSELDIGDILDTPEEPYDYSGELDDFSAYVFWAIVA